MIIGEGAAVIVLETLEHAQKRGAKILGEIVGFGMSADAKDITNPDEGGMIRAIKSALSDARLNPQDVQYINAHGTGTMANDVAETNAIKGAFGAHASKLAISSTKSMVGHALGAAGGLEMVACLMALKDAIVPPTTRRTLDTDSEFVRPTTAPARQRDQRGPARPQRRRTTFRATRCHVCASRDI